MPRTSFFTVVLQRGPVGLGAGVQGHLGCKTGVGIGRLKLYFKRKLK